MSDHIPDTGKMVPGEYVREFMAALVDYGKPCDVNTGAIRAALAAVLPLAIAAERERCLAVAERWSRDGQSATAHGIIIGIRGDAT